MMSLSELIRVQYCLLDWIIFLLSSFMFQVSDLVSQI